jgi:hypothetical protein
MEDRDRKENRTKRKNERVLKRISKQNQIVTDNTPKAKLKPEAKKRAVSVNFALSSKGKDVVNKSTSSSTDYTPPKKNSRRDALGDCQSGDCNGSKTSDAPTSKSKFNSGKASHNLSINKKNFNKRKKAEKKITRLQGKIKPTKSSRARGMGVTPRTLQTGGFLEPGIEKIFD